MINVKLKIFLLYECKLIKSISIKKYCHENIGGPCLTAYVWQEVTTTTVEEKEHAEPNEKTEEFGKEDADHGEEKETPPPTEAPELPASTPASVA
jgi:hypothetical protein